VGFRVVFERVCGSTTEKFIYDECAYKVEKAGSVKAS
jgi:hypothetical protein